MRLHTRILLLVWVIFKVKLPTFFFKWKRWFRPIPGWKQRYKAFLGGKNVWDVPGRPDVPKVVPFPVEWIPHRFEGLQSEEEVKRGFALESVTCVDTGDYAPVGVGVLCIRCGVPLHEKAAGMTNGFDPPKCKRCAPVIAITRL